MTDHPRCAHIYLVSRLDVFRCVVDAEPGTPLCPTHNRERNDPALQRYREHLELRDQSYEEMLEACRAIRECEDFTNLAMPGTAAAKALDVLDAAITRAEATS